jgi:hypothetical protein
MSAHCDSGVGHTLIWGLHGPAIREHIIVSLALGS